ncbi:hypothetical protein DIURU_003209 [Diutina rugosa]|uniref:Vacuolar protein sorting-associated protein 8 central domain-containing protein n=1 Tax=Diutina rugosa TaxID=5481 RepID=A0A642UM17_DIURU|nr:uncharacterized protein DIURU_003209 [Diutina rugosa]KAA8901500.1 hypothetical protein DIURU_003209 [Diutina rugosa]
MPTSDRFDQRQLSDTTRHARAKPVAPSPKPSSNRISHYPDRPVHFATAENVTHQLSLYTGSYGAVAQFAANATHILVGFSQGTVFGFDYRQQLRFKLESAHTESVAVTALATSADGDMVAVGYANGYVLVWHLPSFSSDNQSPWHVIAPTTLKHRFSQAASGHVAVPIDQIMFLHHSHTQMVCTDRSGLVFYHHLVRTSYSTLFSSERQFPTISTKVFGTNDANHVNAKFDILAAAVLPLGLTHQITDDTGVIAILTRTKLTVMSVLSLNIPTKAHIRPVWSVERTAGPASRGSVDWLPCTRSRDTADVVNARLCYSWNDTVTVAEVNNRHIPPNWSSILQEAKDKDKASPPVTMTKTARWRASEGSVTICRWISPQLLLAGTPSSFVVLYYDGKLREVVTQGIRHGHSQTVSPTPISLSPSPSINNATTNQQVSALTVCKQRVVRLVDNTVEIGYVLNWADWIGQLLSQSRYHDAFTIVRELYNLDDDAVVTLFGVERDLATRHHQLRPFLLRILVSDDLEVPLESVVAIVADLMADGAVTEGEQVLQRWFDRSEPDYFFPLIEPYILSGAITSLTPEVLQALVRFYVVNREGVLLTEILTSVDLTSLDIDLTIQLAHEHQLEECLVYVWTRLLHDYTTPLLRFYKEAKPGSSQVFTYMSYILTGRQYPTDQFIADPAEEEAAKKAVVGVVFADHSVDNTNEPNEALFPYLTRFLHLDSRQMLRTLNAFFEDSYSNQGPLSRQYVVDALLDIFDTDTKFTESDRTNLAIFLGRNYPKYSQFLRLSESAMTKVVDTLTSSGGADPDVELALQSMLSVYHPKHTEQLETQLKSSQFYGVLAGVYRSQGHYGKALEMSLKCQSGPQMMGQMLETAFIHTRPHPTQRSALCHTISTHFPELVATDLEALVAMVSKYAPQLHEQLTQLSPEKQYIYLQQLSPVPPALVGVYVRLASEFDNANTVYEVVKRYQGRIEADDVTPQLLKDNHLDAVALLTDDFDQLLALVSQSIDDKEEPVVFQRVLGHAMSHCHHPDEWLKLINRLVDHTHTHPEVVKAIHECFREINSVDSRQTITDPDQPSMFITVLQQFLGQTTNAQLASVRGVLQEVVVSYSYESELSGISLRMLGASIGNSQRILRANTLKGMVVKCDHCTYCTKPLWESNSQYVAWEQRHLRSILPGPVTQETMVVTRNSVAVVFACGHGYHQGCSIKLNGGKAKPHWTCLVCGDDS